MNQPVLRPDQVELKRQCYELWNNGARNALLVLPTGGGKSVIASDIFQDKLRMGKRQAIIAHRNELVSQLSLHTARRGIPHRIIAPSKIVAQIISEHKNEFGGRVFVNQTAPTVVSGVDTIVARKDELTPWAKQVSDWFIDEAHHVLAANKWGTAVAMFQNAIGFGVTATPCRADGKGLGAHHDGVFNAMAQGLPMRRLIELGALTDYEFVLPESDFQIEDDAITDSGDFSTKKMRDAAKRSHITGDVVIEYLRHARGKRAICFATDVETANEIAKNFNDFGIPAASVSAKTDTNVRLEYVRRFRLGLIQVLVNVDLFGEGFDVPACEVVIMARPTASLAVYLQQIGRGLRPMPGKLFGLVIDHVGNWKRHGFPDKPHRWTLDRREKRAKKKPDDEEIPLTRCLSELCGKPYVKALPRCPFCGEAPPLPEPGGRGSPEKVEGNLVLLDREALAKLRAEIELDSPAAVASRATFAAGEMAGAGAAKRQIEKIAAQKRLKDAIAQWAGIQRFKGRDDQESYRRFYLTLGFDVLSALGSARTRQEYEETAEIIEGWCKNAIQ